MFRYRERSSTCHLRVRIVMIVRRVDIFLILSATLMTWSVATPASSAAPGCPTSLGRSSRGSWWPSWSTRWTWCPPGSTTSPPRSYMQTLGPNHHPNVIQARMYSSYLDCVVKISRTEGLRAFYKGLVAQYFRIGPHSFLSLLFWHHTRSQLGLLQST